MPTEHPDPVHWEKVAVELRAARVAQQRTWGDIDNTTLGRYLADETTSSERAAVETALETLPELKLLTDLVRDVLADSSPAAAPSVPFRRPVTGVPKSPWHRSRQRVAILAAACLFLALGTWLFPF